MKHIYDGVVALDNKGEAVIDLPDWFGAVNKDFRYQLTAIGAPGPNLYIAEEISNDVTDESNSRSNNRFKIAGGTPHMKVSWNVTGIRKDPWANAHRIQVEEDKPDKECGYYLYPELYGQPEKNGISHLLFQKGEQELLIHEIIHEIPKKIYIPVNTNVVGMRISSQLEKAINDQIAYEASAINAYVANGMRANSETIFAIVVSFRYQKSGLPPNLIMIRMLLNV
jgi:hypothetical protein